MSRLLSSVPEDAFARAAYSCRAFRRSLMHFENHVRRTRDAARAARKAEADAARAETAVRLGLERWSVV